MALASYQSIEAALSELEDVYSDERRFLSLSLTFLRKRTGDRLLSVGGVWDRHANKWTDRDGESYVIAVNDNQVPIVLAFGRSLAARLNGEPRKPFLVTGGNRRGGKSWIIVALALAMAVAIPGAIVWMVSPILDKREELERYLKGHAAPGWLKPTVREFKFTLPHGSTIKNITGEDEDALKRGEADLVIYNEPQLMSQGVLVNGAPAVIDQGGLVLFAGNPAQKRKGVWFTRLWKAIESGRYPHGELYPLDRRDNPNVNAETARQIADLLKIVSPEASRADDDGVFVEPGNFCYAEHFDERRNSIATLPEILPVITDRVIRARGAGTTYDTLIGADFQASYGNCGVELVIAGDLARPTFYVRRYHLHDGHEQYFLNDVFEIWDQKRTLFIGDPSGAWQDAPHTQAGFRGRDTFRQFRERGWKILPPREKRSDKGLHAAHPPVADCINLVNLLLDEGRLIVCMDEAGPVAEALQRCEYSTRKGRESVPGGAYAHLTDALRYAIYWAIPRAKANGSAPKPGTHRELTIARSGPKIL